MRSVFLGLVLGACVVNAYAGTTTGTVRQVFVNGYNDTILFSIDSSQPSFAGCATTGRYAISTSTQQGKNVFTTVHAAALSGRTITVVGTNACTADPNAEDISYLSVD